MVLNKLAKATPQDAVKLKSKMLKNTEELTWTTECREPELYMTLFTKHMETEREKWYTPKEENF